MNKIVVKTTKAFKNGFEFVSLVVREVPITIVVSMPIRESVHIFGTTETVYSDTIATLSCKNTTIYKCFRCTVERVGTIAQFT